MKITSDADVERLGEKIQEELGVDIRVYGGKAVIESLTELDSFLLFAMTQAYKIPLFVVLGLFLFTFYSAGVTGSYYWVIGLVGLFLFLALGMVITLFRIVSRIKSVILEVIDFTIETVKSILVDLKHVQSKMTPENEKRNSGLLFKGVLHIIAIPLVTTSIAEGVPLIGGFLKKIIKSILRGLSNQYIIIDDTHKATSVPNDQGSTKPIDFGEKLTRFTEISDYLKSKADLSIKIIKIPLILLFVSNLFGCLLYALVLHLFF